MRSLAASLPARASRCSSRLHSSVAHLRSAETGAYLSSSYRLSLRHSDGRALSFWHDVPLRVPGAPRTLFYVNEIARGERAKMEMNLSEPGNPIMHDIRNEQIRTVAYAPYLFNYGFLPQTWEDPSIELPETGTQGDGDPLDVVEVGAFPPQRGQIVAVKVIGALALIDEGETDWKIITINVEDPRAPFINTVKDLERNKKGALFAIKDFFVNYKTPDGKPKNTLGFDGRVKGVTSAMEIVEKHHTQYKDLIAGKGASGGQRYYLVRTEELAQAQS